MAEKDWTAILKEEDRIIENSDRRFRYHCYSLENMSEELTYRERSIHIQNDFIEQLLEEDFIDTVRNEKLAYGLRRCQAFLKMSQKNFNISPDSSGLFATMGIYPLRYNSIIHVMRLFLNKFEEGSPSPWMIHGRDIRLLGLLLWQVHV